MSASVRKLEDTIGIALFTAMLGVVLTQVFVRFLLYRWVQIAWADEIGRALLVWSSFWGAVLVTREGRHITVDLVYDRLSSPMRRVLRVLGDSVMGGFMLLVVWKGLPIFLARPRRPRAPSWLAGASRSTTSPRRKWPRCGRPWRPSTIGPVSSGAKPTSTRS